MSATRVVLVLAAAFAAARPAFGQDSVPPARGVRIGITYTPGVRPGMLVLGGAADVRLDSVRAIIARDLHYSDRFEMITLPGGDSLTLGLSLDTTAHGTKGRPNTGGAAATYVNYPLYAALGADYTVNVAPTPGASGDSLGLTVGVYDVRGRTMRRQLQVPAAALAGPDFRMAVHRLSDAIVQAAAGTPGIAATRLLFIQRGRVYRVDSDGADLTPLTPEGVKTFSPTWGPKGKQIAYMQFDGAKGHVYIQDATTGARHIVAPTEQNLNFTPEFSPDGRTLVFSRASGDGTDIFSYNIADHCCLQRLTVGRFADNLSPTFSPDGRRIAFVSTRAGLPQIYVMAADGTGQELFAPFDYGVTGSSNGPEWSPDGLNIAFHRDVAGSPQVFVMDVASRTVRQLTSLGRNEDPTWAPDGRHIAFVSNRTGNRQLWIIDLDTGSIRQLTRVGEARLPAWSPRID